MGPAAAAAGIGSRRGSIPTLQAQQHLAVYVWGTRLRKIPTGNVRCLGITRARRERAASGRRGGANLREHRPIPGYRPRTPGNAGAGPPAAGRAAVLPEQAALRRPGYLPAAPVPRAGRARPPRGGVLRPALPRAGAAPAAAHAAQPRPLTG